MCRLVLWGWRWAIGDLADYPRDDNMAIFVEHSRVAVAAFFVRPKEAPILIVLENDIPEIATNFPIGCAPEIGRAATLEPLIMGTAETKGVQRLLALRDGATLE